MGVGVGVCVCVCVCVCGRACVHASTQPHQRRPAVIAFRKSRTRLRVSYTRRHAAISEV